MVLMDILSRTVANSSVLPSEPRFNRFMMPASQKRISHGQSTLLKSTVRMGRIRRISKPMSLSLVLQLIVHSGRLFIPERLQFVLDAGSNVNNPTVGAVGILCSYPTH